MNPHILLLLLLRSPAPPPSPPPSGIPVPVSLPQSCDVISILSFVILALILSAGLCSLLLLLRRQQRLEAKERMPAAVTLPSVVFSSGAHLGGDCAICLSEFADGEIIRVFPTCNHGFHAKCIREWISGHSTCPTCRRSCADLPIRLPPAKEKMDLNPKKSLRLASNPEHFDAEHLAASPPNLRSDATAYGNSDGNGEILAGSISGTDSARAAQGNCQQ
ncbi:RING-H2 finger protein ATL79 [Apostasia shenzhenica]|uniref:RING-H2 finger protein ATL79 n=1 Tax=Apostasia shenzhenica TaxID=1088818 RepID=A0A2I0B8Q0_9ASPA|nr:RING-H2 finger protein ATL79 [Apostasia shenzhenica]